MCILKGIPCIKNCESKNPNDKCSILERDKMIKVDMKTERTKQQWQELLAKVKQNKDNTLSKEEQKIYISMINRRIEKKIS